MPTESSLALSGSCISFRRSTARRRDGAGQVQRATSTRHQVGMTAGGEVGGVAELDTVAAGIAGAGGVAGMRSMVAGAAATTSDGHRNATAHCLRWTCLEFGHVKNNAHYEIHENVYLVITRVNSQEFKNSVSHFPSGSACHIDSPLLTRADPSARCIDELSGLPFICFPVIPLREGSRLCTWRTRTRCVPPTSLISLISIRFRS